MNKPINNDRFTTWLLLLHEFNITILDRPGKQNIVVFNFYLEFKMIAMIYL